MEKGTKNTDRRNSNSEKQKKRRLPRVERRRERTRKRIMEIGAEKFALEGLSQVKLELIADEADISRATLYSHFASKEEILREIIRPVIDELARNLKEKKATNSNQGLENIIEVFTDMWDEHGTALVLALRYILHCPGDMSDTVNKIYSLTDSALRPLHNDGALRAKTDLARGMLIQSAIVLLDVLQKESNRTTLFRECLRGLVLKKS